ADATRLAQCFGNLLTNAAKYTDPGGRIRVECRPEGDLALIEVSDNGCGLSAELIDHVFDLYVQDERTRDRAEGGLGIGLPVVKRLIELQGGSVRALSAGPGRGASFQIRLPVAAAPLAASIEATPYASRSRRIFIVDDNVDGARSLALLLQAEGHRVQTAHTASEALEQVDAFKPDVALIDIGLPQMDGYELLESLRSRPALRNTRFIALTGYPRDEVRDRSLRVRFDIYLIKPVDAEMLARTLRDVYARQPQGGHAMPIEELMTRQVEYCAPEDSLQHAAQLMWQHDCGCIPVCSCVEGVHRVVGVITDRDICMCALFQRKALGDLRVSDAMGKDLHACQPGDSVETAQSLMRTAKVRRLPVLDAQGRLCGLIALADLARAATRQASSAPQVISESEVGDTLAAICVSHA